MTENVFSDEAESLFVKVAILNGVVTEAQVRDCLELRERIAALGVRSKPVSEILLERGVLDRAAFEKVKAHAEKLAQAHRIPGYRLVRKLGQGSMGTVYEAFQLSLDRVVAIKILTPSLVENEAFVERFLREAKVLAKLNHPNIVQGIDVGGVGTLRYFVMEYCDGPTVLSLLKRGGAMDEDRAINIIVQVARALEHASRQGLVHRDIKPDNIMIVEGGVAKLCDLGLAKDISGEGGVTETGSTMGTPNYISPEQARGDPRIDMRSDIYSLGATFYHMLTGSPPFEGPNSAVIMVKHISEPPVPPRRRNKNIDPATERIVLKMMLKRPEYRYQSHTELLDDLDLLVGRHARGFKGPQRKTSTRRRRYR